MALIHVSRDPPNQRTETLEGRGLVNGTDPWLNHDKHKNSEACFCRGSVPDMLSESLHSANPGRLTSPNIVASQSRS